MGPAAGRAVPKTRSGVSSSQRSGPPPSAATSACNVMVGGASLSRFAFAQEIAKDKSQFCEDCVGRARKPPGTPAAKSLASLQHRFHS